MSLLLIHLQLIAALSAQPPGVQPRKPPKARPKKPHFTHAVYLRALRGTVWVRAGKKSATGVLVDRDRRIVVVELSAVSSTDRVTVHFPKFRNGRLLTDPSAYRSVRGHKGKVVRRDRKRNIAFIALDSVPATARPLKLAAKGPVAGEPVVALPHPGAGGALWRLRDGVVTGVSRSGDMTVIDSVSMLNMGRGGILINSKGELIGIDSLATAAPVLRRKTMAATNVRPLVEESTKGYYRVKVFYGTNRLPTALVDRSWWSRFRRFFLTLWGAVTAGFCLVAALIAAVIAFVKPRRRKAAGIGAFVFVAIPVVLGAAVAWRESVADAEQPGRFYSGERGERLRYGTCTVSIPKDHRLGDLEAPPSLFGFKFQEDPQKHVVLLDVEEDGSARSKDFLRDFKQSLAESEHKQVLVYIHGYNTTFEDAARRAAQLFYDLEFDGVPAFYSWPSQGKELAYTADENNVEISVPHFQKFLTRISRETGARQIHVIGHSMGNRILARTLKNLAADKVYGKGTNFREIVLAAPDIDAEVFQSDIVPRIVNGSQRVTLYASSNDSALKKSMQVHGGLPRAGETGDNLVVVPPMETIDVSALDTSLSDHSYYASNKSVISDLYYLLRGRRAGKRHRLEKKTWNGRTYWAFKP